ncbi:MAG: FAD-dependent thymidylate synthase [Clostridia bacterium]|nr:FAD-dependent thymidylate synthase [Clostridia bacterium]
MGTVTILKWTPKDPLCQMGYNAGYCWGADVSDDEKNIKRAKDCILSGHGRTMEFPEVNMVLEGYSARVMREWYTHIGGAPTRLQASTRYIEWKEEEFTDEIVLPKSVQMKLGHDLDSMAFKQAYDNYVKSFNQLIDFGKDLKVPKEDLAMFYPLGMKTKVACKHNARNLMDMSRQRMCSRAYWEYRQLFNDVCKALSEYSEQWKWIVDNCFMPKCEATGECPEKYSCGRKPQRSKA